MSDAAAPELRRRAERRSREETGLLDEVLLTLATPIRHARTHLSRRRIRAIAPAANAHADRMAALSDAELAARAREAGNTLRKAGDFPLAPTATAFAALRELLARQSGRRLYDVQLVGAYTMLSGAVAQMATGEGKTLTASLAAATAALAGWPVHVVTVNDYLTERDAGISAPFYALLGLTTGFVTGTMETEARQRAYGCDVCFCTAKDLAFDYLRDRIALGATDSDLHLKVEALTHPRQHELRLRGLHFAIVDEADSVLIDEARTPLVISAQVPAGIDGAQAAQALDLARGLVQGRDFRILAQEHRVTLTPEGIEAVTERARDLGPLWRGRVRREELARQALTALHLFHAGDHYIIRDGKVMIVAGDSGRVMPDRSWSGGLQQLIEVKEGVEASPERRNIARMTYQRLFRRYLRLGGMTGTTGGVRGELWRVYHLRVMTVPTHRPVIRGHLRARILATDEARWRGVVARCLDLHGRGVPVLVGTRSVAGSEDAAARLRAAGLAPEVLNATSEAREAAIIAEAGQPGRVTVVTNMAGRGTDIVLGPGVADSGGLHVILVDRQEARRQEDQFAGRAGRQGDPGSFECWLSLADPILDHAALPLRLLVRHAPFLCGRRLRAFALSHAQGRLERTHAAMRRALLESEKRQGRTLAFTGRQE